MQIKATILSILVSKNLQQQKTYMKKKKQSILLLFWLFTYWSSAQDIHFSQYFASPLNLSASETGNFESDFRLMANYRNQWSALGKPYQTVALGADRVFFLHSQKLSGGIYFAHDKSGGIDLSINQLLVSAAYHPSFSYNNFHVGIQFGWVFKSFDKSKVTLPEQFDNNQGYFNSDLMHHETYQENANYPDFNLGISWSRKLYKFEPFFGFAMQHVFYPKESFDISNNRLPQRYTWFGGVNYNFTPNVDIKPMYKIMYHSDAREYLAGVNVVYTLKQPWFKIEKILLGGHFRDPINFKPDATIIAVGAFFKNIFTGLSYDLNVSKFKTATQYHGAIEFSIIYTGLKTKNEFSTIPCNRY